MCGRRKIDREYPEIAMEYGDMEFELLEKLSKQIPSDIVIQFHNNGEPTLYPRLGESLDLFPNNIRHFDTNGKLIVEKADEIIDKLDTMTISVIQDDKEGNEQYELVKQFLDIKGIRKPYMVYRLLGDVRDRERWEELPGIVANRVIHNPLGSYKYKKKNPTKPEIGVCLDLLHHLVIDRFGYVYPCVRFDPEKEQCIGNANNNSLLDIWNGEDRKCMIDCHLQGLRYMYIICSECEFWGIPIG
jgi:radical SAM protein with 4Fe4S-binding SPASM domain